MPEQAFNFDVFFDQTSDRFHFETDDVVTSSDFEVIVTAQQAKLVFQLADENAHFAPEPIVWLSHEGHQISIPSGMSVNPESDHRVTITDSNSNTSGTNQHFHFELQIVHNGRVHRSDPTIINQTIPPGGAA